ncbi:MAG: tetratricopeptide repeat protein [Caldilineaceae bacterium]
MSALSMPIWLQRLPRRRPLLMVLFSGLCLIVAVVLRLLNPLTSQPVTPPAPVELSSQDAISQLESRLRDNPDDTNAYAQLGLGLLQQVRESGDVSLYARAGKAFDEALARDPKQLDALVGQGILALALHDFPGALEWADKAWAINPFRAQILGIKVDGQVELSRYDEAVQTLQKMVDLRPDLDSYSRVSYVRELYGDVDGAIEAMRSAVQTALPGSESWAWTLTHLGHLYFNRGELTEAAAIYEQVLVAKANYPYALAGQARVAAAQGNTDEAITIYKQITERLPLPEFIIALGELYEATGQADAARQQYDLVGVIQQLNAAAGMNVDLEMGLFTASHGNDPVAAVQQARTAYAERPTIYAADTLAWALYQQGEYAEAWQFSQEALHLGTKDALLHFHAGMIAAKVGDQEAARTHLQTALAINPHFSPLYAPVAQEAVTAVTP